MINQMLSLGRIKRFGQTRKFVDMLNLVYSDTQDEKIYNVLSERLKDTYDIFGSLPDTILGCSEKGKLFKTGSLVKILRNAVEHTAEDDGWAHLAKVGQYISNNTSFSPINYGYKKLSDLIRESDLFQITMRLNNSVMYIKDKRK